LAPRHGGAVARRPNWSAFEADIAKILLRADGSVGKLKIDFFERAVLNDAGTGRFNRTLLDPS
jgi:hypothetical protein